MKGTNFRLIGLVLVLTMLLTASVGAAPAGKPKGPAQPLVEPNCALLDAPNVRGLMSGMFETKLLHLCGRQDELSGKVKKARAGQQAPDTVLVADVQVNNSATDIGASTTQSETSIRINPNTGTICSAYNDSQHWAQGGIGFHGFSRSTNGGATFVDRGPIPAGGGGQGFGDPSLIWRRADGHFYYAALHTNGLGLWRSTDDCYSFAFRSMIHVGGSDDKELMAVDNNPASPYYGRIYVAWTDFNAGGRIYVTYSNDGLAWSAPVVLSAPGVAVQGAWPAVDPVTGDVYVGWVRWNPYWTGPIDIEIVRSVNGGAAWGFVTNPLSGAVNPRDVAATNSCNRPALNREIRYLPSPQVEVDHNSNLHVVYSYDPDGYGAGDVVNVYYRRSTNQGAGWGPQIQLNDDGTTTDQWFPTVSVGPTGVVVATWYDRRNDVANNHLFDYYKVFSYDNGVTWGPNIRVSDVSSAVPALNPNFDPIVATCYHGDYDQQVQDENFVYIQWSDDRNIQNGHPDPDVWFEKEPVEPVPGECYRILFDETHGVGGSFTIGARYDELAAFLEGHGHTVHALQNPDPFDYATISQYDVLVLVLPQAYYSADEKNAIARFVREGRRLVVVGEYGAFAGVSHDILNDVHAHLGDGLFHNDDWVEDPTDYEVNLFWPLIHNFSPHPVNNGVGTVVEYAGSSLQVAGPAYGTAFGDNDTYTVPSVSITAPEGGSSDTPPGSGIEVVPGRIADSIPLALPGYQRAAATKGLDLPPEHQHAATTEGLGLPSAPINTILAAGDVIQSWSPALNAAWGTAYDGGNNTVWVGSPVVAWGGDGFNYEYQPNGAPTGRAWSENWGALYGPADMAFNWNTGMVWHVDVGGDDCLHEMNPAGGYTGNTICSAAWSVSQRGLAYDPATDTWYVGSWNDQTIYHIDSSGTLLDSQNVGLNVAGLAYNPDTQHLFVMVNATPNPIYVLDTAYNILGQFAVSQGFPDYSGAGLEIDCWGDLWAVDQTTNLVYQIDSGETASLCEEVIVQAMSNVSAGDVFAIGDVNLWDNNYGNNYDQTQLAWNVFAYGQVCPENTPPTITGLPDVIVDETTMLPVQIDLWAFASDAETPDSGLTYTIEGSPPPGAGVTIVGNRWLAINPSTSWCGYTEITIRVTDPGGLWDEDTLRVAVSWSCKG